MLCFGFIAEDNDEATSRAMMLSRICGASRVKALVRGKLILQGCGSCYVACAPVNSIMHMHIGTTLVGLSGLLNKTKRKP